jgi:hypothetical protein
MERASTVCEYQATWHHCTFELDRNGSVIVCSKIRHTIEPLGRTEMKMLTCFLAISLIFGLAGVAKADTDFQMVVIDPPPGSFTVNPIDGDNITVTFSPCAVPGQISDPDYVGCWSAYNNTNTALTSLVLTVPPIPGQTAGCTPFGGGADIFANISCGSAPGGGFFLTFSGGDGLPVCTQSPCPIMTIAEEGVDPSVFPQIDGTFNAAVPEPPAFWLLFTGVLGGGFLLNQRRRVFQAPAFRSIK